jgi:hypothetical protein
MRPRRTREGKVLRERTYWWWAGTKEWLLDLPYAWREVRQRAVERVQHRWWRLSNSVLDLLADARGLRRARHALRDD